MREVVHVSALRSFLRCRKQYEYRYERGLVPIGPPPKSWGTGTLFHAGMKSIYRFLYREFHEEFVSPSLSADQAWGICEKTVLEAWKKDGGDGPLAESMIRYYWDNFGRHEQIDEILQVELPVEQPFGDNWLLRGTMDLVYRKGDRIVVRDYKTVDSVKMDPLYMRLDLQFQAYLYILYKHYKQPVELEIIKVRRDVPHELTPTGKPSKTINNPVSDYLRVEPWFSSADVIEKFGKRVQGVLEAIDYERGQAIKTGDAFPRTDNSPSAGIASCTACPYFMLCGKELIEGQQEDQELSLLYSTAIKETL